MSGYLVVNREISSAAVVLSVALSVVMGLVPLFSDNIFAHAWRDTVGYMAIYYQGIYCIVFARSNTVLAELLEFKNYCFMRNAIFDVLYFFTLRTCGNHSNPM